MEEKNSMLKLFQTLSVNSKTPIFTNHQVKPKANNYLFSKNFNM